MWVQPWIALLGVIDNGLVVLIMGLMAGKQLAATIRTSRIYYVVISAAEIGVMVVGTVFRNSIPTFSLLVSLLAVTNQITVSIRRFCTGYQTIYQTLHG